MKDPVPEVTRTAIVTFGVKTSEGNSLIKETAPVRFTSERCAVSPKAALSLDDLVESKVIFTCRIQEVAAEVTSPPIDELETLSSHFKDLFTSQKKCDVTIKVKEEKTFGVHQAVLVARSSVFAAMFEHGMAEGETGVVAIPDCDPGSFEEFLKYLYTGKTEGVAEGNAHHLYATADKYDVQGLKSFCHAFMKWNLTAKNVCDVVALAERFENFELMASAQSFFNRNFGVVFSMTEWEELMKLNSTLANKLLKEMARTVSFANPEEQKNQAGLAKE